MRPYQKENVVFLALYRLWRKREKELTVSWKNRLVTLSDSDLAAEKWLIGKMLIQSPQSFDVLIKWKQLQEVEHDRKVRSN